LGDPFSRALSVRLPPCPHPLGRVYTRVGGLPLLGSGEIEQLPPVDVLGADDAWVLTRPARFTGVCAAARAGCYISLDVGWRDESRTRRIGTVRGVRCGEFQDEVLIRRDEVVGEEARHCVYRDPASTAFKRLLCRQGMLECLCGHH
jgi:hypothetical protein